MKAYYYEDQVEAKSEMRWQEQLLIKFIFTYVVWPNFLDLI